MTTLYETLPNDLLCTSTLDEHEYVKKFYNNQNVNGSIHKKDIIMAYIVRDLYYNGNLTVKQLMDKHCDKLNLNPSEEQLKSKKQIKFIEAIKNMVTTEDFPDMKIEQIYNYFLNTSDENQTSKLNKDKYNLIMKIIEENYSLEDIYDIFTIEELTYLGW